MKPAVTLPLSPSMNRCLAEGQKVGESCERKDQCARHVTIEHDDEPVPAYYRACHSDLMVAFIPLTGWPEEEVESCAPKANPATSGRMRKMRC